jgi:hypothetical protein
LAASDEPKSRLPMTIQQAEVTAQQAEVTADPRALNVAPPLIADLGEEAAWRYVEFFTANIRNPNMRRANARDCNRFFAWCDDRGLMPAAIRPHDVATFRATGVAADLANGGALEHAQEMAAHESPRTTKLYDRTKERLTQDEVERIRL